MGVSDYHPRPSANHLQHVPIVFVPGLKCSLLKDSTTGKTAWFTPKMLLLNRKFADLQLPFEYDDKGSQLSDGIVPHKVVHHVKFGPRTYPIYAPCLKDLREQGRQVYEFPYDWRRDLLETSGKLLEFVEKVSRMHHGSKVQMVTHSMGGIVTLAAVNMRPELFHSCVFGSPPFQPCAPMFIEYISNGRSAGRNRKMLTSRVHFSWSSAYGVFPLHGHGIVDSEGKPLHFDFFDVNTWVREQWGILHPEHPETVVGDQEYDKYISHLKRALARGKQFQEWIQREHDIAYPPMAVIAGTGHPTRVRLMKDGPDAKWGIDEKGYPLNHHGDDLIQVPDTHVPAGIPHYHYTTTRAHAFVLNDLDTLRRALRQVDPYTQAHDPAHHYPKSNAESAHSQARGRYPHIEHDKRGNHSHSRPRHNHHHDHHQHPKTRIAALRAHNHARNNGSATSSIGPRDAESNHSDSDLANGERPSRQDAGPSPRGSKSLSISPGGSGWSLPQVDTGSLSELDTPTQPTSPAAKGEKSDSIPKMLRKRLSLVSLSSISLGLRNSSSNSP